MAEAKAPDQRSPAERFNEMKNDFIMSQDLISRIREDFSREMERGLAGDAESSLKMLGTCVFELPTGSETGVYYSLDWGGTNYRVLRSEFFGHEQDPVVQETKVRITEEFQHTEDADQLFDHLAQVLKEHMAKCNDDSPAEPFPIGFTFSFPMRQAALDEAILINWTKGFTISSVVGQNVAEFMHQAFERHNVPARIRSVCNDTTGTLIACAFDEPSTRIGLILGTGINAAYVEPSRGGEIINTELGGFSLVPRTDVDRTIDEYTANPGDQFAEKMVSGFYLGEVARVFALQVFGEQMTNQSEAKFLEPWGFGSDQVSRVLDETNEKMFLVKDILNDHGIVLTEEADLELFRDICQVVVNRSADLAATTISCVIERTGVEGVVTVGVDGSVFKYMHGYEQRMRETLGSILGVPKSDSAKLVHASDGSGKGAALVAAAGGRSA